MFCVLDETSMSEANDSSTPDKLMVRGRRGRPAKIKQNADYIVGDGPILQEVKWEAKSKYCSVLKIQPTLLRIILKNTQNVLPYPNTATSKAKNN